jgi:hypothetical protein
MQWHNNGASFQEHNEYMRDFRHSHASVATVNAPRYGESALLRKTMPFQVGHSLMEARESRFPNDVTDWSALVPVPKVARYKLSQN